MTPNYLFGPPGTITTGTPETGYQVAADQSFAKEVYFDVKPTVKPIISATERTYVTPIQGSSAPQKATGFTPSLSPLIGQELEGSQVNWLNDTIGRITDPIEFMAGLTLPGLLWNNKDTIKGAIDFAQDPMGTIFKMPDMDFGMGEGGMDFGNMFNMESMDFGTMFNFEGMDFGNMFNFDFGNMFNFDFGNIFNFNGDSSQSDPLGPYQYDTPGGIFGNMQDSLNSIIGSSSEPIFSGGIAPNPTWGNNTNDFQWNPTVRL